MDRRRSTGRILRLCVTEHPWARAPEGLASLVAQADPAHVARAADFHGVSGCVYHSLRALPGGSPPPLLERQYHQTLINHLRTLADLAQIAPVLDGLGVPWIVVKGPVLAETVYTRPDLRSYGDLDVVVPSTALGTVLGALEANGAAVVDRNWRLLEERMFGQVLLSLPHGTPLDLHWHLVHDVTMRRRFRIPMADVLARARRTRVARTAVPVLDSVDSVLFLALHACLAGGNRLVWLKDLEQAVRWVAPFWDDIVTRSRAWDVSLPVAVTLGQARSVLGAAVPVDLLDALGGGRGWARIAAAAYGLCPVERALGKRSVARLVTRSTRTGVPSSALELARHVTAGVSRPFLGTPPAVDTNPESPKSARHAAGDRYSYLRAVARDA